jgi:serine/threonine protein phosphatase PrpC
VRVLVGAATDVGRVRERNEDGFLTREPLFAVADGMGGHRGGSVASKLALEVLSQMGGDSMTGDGAALGLAEMVTRANEAVLDAASEQPKLTGMGTTLTAIVVQPGRLHLAHVGDSRAYLLRDGALRQLTEDHSLVQRMVKEGKLTPEEAEVHPHRSVLTRALGVEPELEVDKETIDVQPGDRLLLCSDGLTTMVSEKEIQTFLAEHDNPQAAAEALVEAANQAGGVDNITAVVLHVLDGNDAASDEASRAEERATTPAAVGGTGSGSEEEAAGVATAVRGPFAEPASATSSPATQVGKPERRRRRPLRILIWLVVVAAILGAGLMSARAYVFSQWYVGLEGERVALFQGMPVEVLGYELRRVVEVTDLSADQAMQLRPWRHLADGITAQSEQEARSILATIERDLAAEARRPGAGSG